MTISKKYTLKAQSPLIHFQLESGAKLRATAVKPMLDKFLIACAERENINYSSWLIAGTSNKSLEYKMKFDFSNEEHVNENNQIYISNTKKQNEDKNITMASECPMFFGEVGGNVNVKVVFNDLEVEIICCIPSLLEYIDKKIAYFFVSHNFGTRSDKGYGSYVVKDYLDKNEIKNYILKNIKCAENMKLPYCAAFYIEVNGKKAKERMDCAEDVYKKMRLFLRKDYFSNTFSGKHNDKEFIFNDLLQKDDFEYLFIRSLLGLASFYENGDKKYYLVNYNVNDENNKVTIDDIKNDCGIRRFQSPVLIKVFRNRIYFIFTESYKLILNKTFFFMNDNDYKKYKENLQYGRYSDIVSLLERCPCLKTPSEFDPVRFFNNFIDQYNNNKRKDLELIKMSNGGN